ncbi:MAG: hypothetical protein LBM20_07520 [Rikenellaceae bacterium]|jgi:hypothetical protein|nr:hypothetical protein [Rikenellaceae bacterium]
MKKMMFLFLVAVMCMANVCNPEESENYHRTVKVTNNADYAIYVTPCWIEPWENPEAEFFKYPWRENTEKGGGTGEPENRVNPGETNTSAMYQNRPTGNYEGMGSRTRLRLYIVDAAAYDQIPIGATIPNETLLDRRDYSLEDLRAINFHIHYPWDE